MTEIENFSEISENFDTIKTLLNSIRAQGILNTSDVDKLLSGINTKLEKINTEEDIDLIKIFLSELKQSLEERHSVLVSKFGAIESLFTNLLKNSNEVLKANEAKELFDIVATNLSVFSREVVSQKETLTDIALRLEALRSDDSTEKNIIKNITLLKPDLERLNNGFDSIVLSLNDNFKAIIKTITTIDKTEHLDKFSDSLANLEMASNTLLSAIQVLDKKSEQIDSSLKNLATKEDSVNSLKKLDSLSSQTRDILTSLSSIDNQSVKIDILSDKIDGSVNVIANLKTLLQDAEEKNFKEIYEQIQKLEKDILQINPEIRFEEFRGKIEALLNSISTLQEANLQKLGDDIAKNANGFNAQLSKMQSDIGIICERNFNSVLENISDLRKITSQIEENGISANNAIYSSISDRLAIFESSLTNSLDINEKTVSQSSAKLAEQVDNIKNLSDVLTYKVDASIVEIGNTKRGFEDLKKSVDAVLSLGFADKVKDLRVDLYASKQELQNAVESSSADVSEKLSKDLFSKYELLIKKLEQMEDELQKTRAESFNSIKTMLEKISYSIVDVLTYVSERKTEQTPVNTTVALPKYEEILKDLNLNYVENVRDIVDIIRIKIEDNLKNISQDVLSGNDSIRELIEKDSSKIQNEITELKDDVLNDNTIIKNLVSGCTENLKSDIESVTEKIDIAVKSSNANTEDVKKDIKYSYSKLLEILDSYKEIKEMMNLSSISSENKLEGVVATTNSIKADFEERMSVIKEELDTKIADFQDKFIGSNTEKHDELRDLTEKLSKCSEEKMAKFVAGLKETMTKLSTDDVNIRAAALAKILDNIVSLKEYLTTLDNQAGENLKEQVLILEKNFKNICTLLAKVDENIDSDMTRLLSIVETNFETLLSRITELSEKSDNSISDKINSEFLNISDKINDLIASRLGEYREEIKSTFNNLEAKTLEQSDYLQEKIKDFNESFSISLSAQANTNIEQLQSIADELRTIFQEKADLSQKEYKDLQNQLLIFFKNVAENNKNLTGDVENKLEDITKEINSLLDSHALEVTAKNGDMLNKLEELSSNISSNQADFSDEVSSAIEKNATVVKAITSEGTKQNLENLKEFIGELKQNLNEAQHSLSEVSSANFESLSALLDAIMVQLGAEKQAIEGVKTFVANNVSKECETLLVNIEKQTKILNDALLSQFEQQKIAQEADLLSLTSKIDEIVTTHLSDNISELKSLLQVETDTTEIEQKLDKLNLELNESVSEMIKNLNRMLDTNVFKTALSDYKLANEVLVSSAMTSMNEKIETFIEENVSDNIAILSAETRKIHEKLGIFDKRLMDAIVDKYEEIKLISNNSSKSLEELKTSVSDVLSNIVLAKNSLDEKIEGLIEVINSNSSTTNNEIKALVNNFEELKAQISTKSSDEKFQSLMNAQVDELKNLVVEQLGYIEDINDLCCTNLPDITELNALVKDSILESIKAFSTKMESQITSIADVSTKMTSQIGTMSDVSGKLNTQLDSITDVSERINSQADLIEGVSDKLTSQESILNDIYANTDTNGDVLKNISGTIDEQTKVVSDINEKIDLQEDALISVRSVLDDQDGSIKDIASILEAQENKISVISNSLESQNYGIDTLSSALEKQSNSINDIIQNIEQQDIQSELEGDFKQLKSDIINHILDVFNQISFVAEEEEILDFIQEKHNELITILSHIVTNSNELSDVKNNVEYIKDEINIINSKISSIISGDGDVDYVYSLHDLETDIANLRVILNEIKDSDNHDEFVDLVSSTNDIYNLVQSIKSELPHKNDFDSMAEDIESISSRTNKLLLTSDESYKFLQDNLQDFKLVINDLDERTRNFSRESGIDRIDSKLNAINSMIVNGSKTNQVFNQVFEYLAEWVDNASVQINSISDRIETLNEIGQIKDMIVDLKTENSDNSDSEELVNALGIVFDKQTKRISSIETKLDRMIVENAVRDNSVDLSPMENTLNKFLVSLEEKFTAQQEKVNNLEARLEEILKLVDTKETNQLTKKVGGMDKQIAKLNKSIEKIASHVIEK